MSCVYFVRAGDMIKIGHTTRPMSARLAALQCGSPVRLEIIKTVHGGGQHEMRLHARFASLRVRGEWFRATAELLAFVESLPRAETAARRMPGRPRVIGANPRGQRITILLTLDELRELDARALVRDVDRSRVIREAIFPVGNTTRRDA